MNHLTQTQIEAYSNHRLPAAELLAVDDHLAACEACARRLETALSADAAFFGIHDEAFAEVEQSSVHLTSAQSAEYVNKNLTAEEMQFVTDHLNHCEQCVLAVEDLRAFRNEIAPSLDRQYGPTQAPVVEKPSLWERFASRFKVSLVPAFGTGALALLLLAFIAWVVWRTPRQENPEVVVVPTPTQQPSPSVAPTIEPVAPVVVAQLNDGNAVMSLDQAGTLFGADTLPARYQELVKQALNGQRIERSSQLQGLTRPPSTLMGSDDRGREFTVIEPAGTVLLNDRPRFRWSNLEGATSYVVEVYDEQFKLVTSSPQLTERSWTSAQSLPRGVVYSWQVKAIKDGEEITSPRPPAPQAKFRVLDQAKANELANAKRAYGTSHLTLGLLYANAGLLREAEQEFRLLRNANPESEVARNLLRQVQAMRR